MRKPGEGLLDTEKGHLRRLPVAATELGGVLSYYYERGRFHATLPRARVEAGVEREALELEPEARPPAPAGASMTRTSNPRA